MRLLIVSDIHANLAAFEAVLSDADGEFDRIWCLGDLVGYGPDPNECVNLLRQFDHVSLSGNHDWAVLGKLELADFNPEARRAIEWTRETITPQTHSYLDALPPDDSEVPFTLVHASPRQPLWEYVLDMPTAAANFSHFETRFCLIGHSHVPLFFVEEAGEVSGYRPVYGSSLALEEGRFIINPGSVGQPRDSDPRAAYALLDNEALTWEFRRVAYPIATTQQKMRAAGMPPRLVTRLEYGW